MLLCNKHVVESDASLEETASNLRECRGRQNTTTTAGRGVFLI